MKKEDDEDNCIANKSQSEIPNQMEQQWAAIYLSYYKRETHVVYYC